MNRVNQKNNSLLRGHHGFTLIELLIVIAIIGVMVAIAVPSIVGSVNKARIKTDIANAKTIANAAMQVIADDSSVSIPATLEEVKTGSTDKFIQKLEKTIQQIPKTKVGTSTSFYIKEDSGVIEVYAGASGPQVYPNPTGVYTN